MAGKTKSVKIGSKLATYFPTSMKLDKGKTKTHIKGPFQLKTEQTVWDLPIRILPTLPSLAESGIAEAQVTKLL